MREEELPFLKQVRRTVQRSGDLLERARLRMDETDRLLAKQGLSRESLASEGEGESEEGRWPFALDPQLETVDSKAVQRHRVRVLRRLLKVARV